MNVNDLYRTLGAKNKNEFIEALSAFLEDAGSVEAPDDDPTWTSVQAALDDISARLAVLEAA